MLWQLWQVYPQSFFNTYYVKSSVADPDDSGPDPVPDPGLQQMTFYGHFLVSTSVLNILK
jgi:hypothetical protein